jgi:S-adenosylmethionine:tRNA-ribosyltransferase-isomerase (queuine synthetase)
MMVSAFCGHDLMKRATLKQSKKNTNSIRYGDAMLII